MISPDSVEADMSTEPSHSLHQDPHKWSSGPWMADGGLLLVESDSSAVGEVDS